MITNIQILRFFAALAVVQYHAIDVFLSYGFELSLLTVFKGWGASGVDLFFVVSGFVLYKIILSRSIGPVEFFRDRVIRIVPLYWIYTCLLALLLSTFPHIARDESFDTLRLLSSLFFVSGPVGYSFPTLGVGWTLEFEFFFYAVLTFGMAFSLKKNLFLFVSLVFSLFFLFGSSNSLLFEFLFGMLAVTLTSNKWAISYSRAILVVSVFFVLTSILLTGQAIDRALIYGVPSFLLVFSLVLQPQARNGILAFLGDASFSIYLVHQPILSLLAKLFEKFSPNLNGDVATLTAIAISVLIGTLSYVLLEKPLIFRLKDRFCKSSHV